MVMHIVIPPAPAPDDEPPRPWPPEDARYNVLTDPRLSVAVRTWALLHIEPHTMPDICDFLDTRRETVYAAVRRLRRHTQRIVRTGALYALEPSPPLQVVHVPERGVILEPGDPRYIHLRLHIRCVVAAGIPRIEVLDPAGPPPPASRPAPPDHPLWRPPRGLYAEAGDLQPRSIAIWVWGLLKAGAWTTADLARELEVDPTRITRALAALRARGHRIQCDMRDRHYLRDDGRHLRVIEHGGRLVLARADGRTAGRDFDLW